jgi:hypothetical protein
MIKTAMIPSGNGLLKMDVIEHEGEPWLVPEWLQNIDQGRMQPAWMIRMFGIAFQETPGGPYGDFIVNNPIPQDVLEGQTDGGQFVVIHRPEIWLPTGGVQ